MKRVLNVAFIFCMVYNSSIAQVGKGQKTVPNPYEANLKTLTNGVLTVLNGKAPLSKLTGPKSPKPVHGWLDYNAPALAFPGALETKLSAKVKWEGTKGKSSWVWRATLLKYAKGTQTEKLKNELSAFTGNG